MEVQILQKWSNLLLDTGKGNRLVNFKATKMTLELISPDIREIFKKIELDARFRVCDAPITVPNEGEPADSEEDWYMVEELPKDRRSKVVRQSREQYTQNNLKLAKKYRENCVLVYNDQIDPLPAIQSIKKKGMAAIEETGVNILYLAFGFIKWREEEGAKAWMKAPILLVPVTVENESSVDPFYIRVIEDDITLNPTFAYKMLTDYGIKMPEMEEGEDLLAYFDRIQKRFDSTTLHWSVEPTCYLGTFSFLKINMYQDLTENAQIIAQSPHVATLADGGMAGGGKDKAADKTPIGQLHSVVDADSSQSEAIEMMKRGKSFVLQGPPGTGKSQTITNIIAEALADGKTVLFVSEKLAALSVVYAKLKAAGLEEFCLELHSHKAHKRQVIEELHRTLVAEKKQVSSAARSEMEALRDAQQKLDAYAEELHKVRPVIGTSLYHLYERFSACRHAPSLGLAIKRLKTKGENHLQNVLAALNKYASYTPSIGYDYHRNVWYGYQTTDQSFEARQAIATEFDITTQLLTDLQDTADLLRRKYNITADNYQKILALVDVFEYLKDSQFASPLLLSQSDIPAIQAIVEQMKPHALSMIEDKSTLEECFDDSVYDLDGRELFKALSVDFESFFTRLFSKEYKALMNSIRRSKINGKKSSYAEAVEQMRILQRYQKDKAEFDELAFKVETILGAGYQGYTTNFDALIADLQRLATLDRTTAPLADLLTMSKENFEAQAPAFAQIAGLLQAAFQKSAGVEKICMAKFDPRICDMTTMLLSDAAKRCQNCHDNIDKLDNWVAFTGLLAELKKMDVLDFVDTAIQEMIGVEDLAPAFQRSFLAQWIDAILHDARIMIDLSRVPHDQTVDVFKAKDVLGFEINKAIIRSTVQARRPNLDLVAPGSPIAILRHEAGKKRKQKGIRQLLDEIKDLALTIKPCFLMSPLSVSTFLTADIKFDVVIFDEASQIFPQDAVGSIYRGKQLIVVGDTKQMPPSNFFGAVGEVEEEDSDDTNLSDYESILDLCAVAYPQYSLKWHYRSRFEQLISFSNRNFYDNTLVTFPSARADGLDVGVDYYYIENGVFDRKSRTNRAEAERIVDMVFEHFEKHPQRSLGVVAFSVSQQELIERLIDKRRAQDHSKEEFFKSDREEPFFVKNLETVQGDERDTIIFSVAYAKDSQGRLYMNFGPINKTGGERRLNVAFTRAKYNVKLVSSMRYTDIDLSRTQARGTQLLREYLDFAENGMVALERALDVNAYHQYDSDFEEEVCDFLRENGYHVDTQVGCSSFRIDLALKHPDTSNYVLAIECDGATYHASKSARDRDRLRQSVLENMGWRFYRIWSTDWFRNKRVEQEALLKAVKQALENTPTSTEQVQQRDFSFEEKRDVQHFTFPIYSEVDIAAMMKKHRNDIPNVVRAILEVESPLSEEWLLKRACRLFYDRMKVTSLVVDKFNQDMAHCDRMGVVRKDGFLYLLGKEAPMLRVPKDSRNPAREIRYIALAELAQGIKKILEENVSVERSSLYTLIAKQLGFGHAGDAISQRFDEAIQLIQDEIEVNGDVLSLK